MVEAFRRGKTSLREIAKRFDVDHTTVLRWVRRAGSGRLDRVDWSDRTSGPQTGSGRIALKIEDQILAVRQWLRESSPLGEYGARAIREHLLTTGMAAPPSVRTIGRVLERRGALDDRGRVRRPAPPRGWYLPELRARRVELDSFDVVTDLKIEAGPWIEVLTGISLHAGAISVWPAETIGSDGIRASLEELWRTSGRPQYAQFDNDTRFLGARFRVAEVGRVARFCMSLDVTPVFVPPRERGFQSEIERFNGLWQAKVWRRFHHATLDALRARSLEYVAASRWRHAPRIETAPQRRPFPSDWSFDVRHAPSGRIVFIRRTDDHGVVELLQRRLLVGPSWQHRLVRCELDFTAQEVAVYGLRRAAVEDQPLLVRLPYPITPRRYTTRYTSRG